MKKIILSLMILFTLGLLLPQLALGKLGVGVGLGKIQIDEKLNPGGIYKLPSLPVLNTGDEASDYEVEATYLSDQKEMRPDASWFSFSPKSFRLEGGETQLVEVTLTLPVDVRPTDYFAFLEAHPVAKKEGVTIGIAAATKLNFTVEPSGVLGAAVERIRSLFENNKPGSYITLGVLGGVILIYYLSRVLDIKVGLRKKKKKEDQL